jgi:hypothetical protein
MKKATKKRVQKPKPTGPKTLKGSQEAKKQAAIVLEVLSGVRGPQEGCEVMGVSLSRYYQLETRGLQGLITALEPKARGRQSRPEDEIAKLRDENRRLKRDNIRNQSLLRSVERSIGIRSTIAGKGKTKAKKKTGRRRVKVSRATRVIGALRKPEAPEQKPAEAAKP